MRLRTGIALLLTILWSFPAPVAHAQTPVVRAVLFWASTCPHCHVVLEQTLPPLQSRYGKQLEIRLVEISDPKGYELWLQAMDAMAVPAEMQGVPMLFIGDRVLVGSRDIPQQLPSLIERYLSAGGVDYIAIPNLREQPLFTLPAAPTFTATPSRMPTATPTLAARHCRLCDETETPVPAAGSAALLTPPAPLVTATATSTATPAAIATLPATPTTEVTPIGAPRETPGGFISRYATAIKLATAGLIILLAGWLVTKRS
jgi:glutaredoxin